MTDSTRNSLSRRRFLTLGGAAATLPLAGPLAAGPLMATREEGLVRIGYVPDSAGLAGLDDLYLRHDGPGASDGRRLARVRSAREASPDTGARAWNVTLHGMQAPRGGSRLRVLALDVLYRNSDVPGGQLPFRVWQGSPADGDRPRALRFPVPAEALEGLAVTAATTRDVGLRAALGRATGGARRADAGFAAAPGIYLIAAPDGAGRSADWRRLRVDLAQRDGTVSGARLCRRDGRDAGHDCLVLTLTPA